VKKLKRFPGRKLARVLSSAENWYVIATTSIAGKPIRPTLRARSRGHTTAQL
jgi:hypothetical protein